MSETRNNHFVPEWHQKGFMADRDNQLCHLTRRDIGLKSGETKTIYSKKWFTPAQRFYVRDLYSTFFGTKVNDEIEQKLFGPIDDNGSKAVRAFLTDDQSQWHQNFQDFFTYLDVQKIRTPKGLDWIQSKYPKLSQWQLMTEMQSLRHMHSTLWTEGVRELVSAETSDVKFIVSDHPVTVYNYACPPESTFCKHPNDPDITLKGTQTIFALDKNRCLILSNLEYAQDPDTANPLEQRTNATRIRKSMVNTIQFINNRKLSADEVTIINYIIKSRCHSSVAAGNENWLSPEYNVTYDWADLRHVLLPQQRETHIFGGEMYAKYEDGSTYYQDAFGRTKPPAAYLNKSVSETQIGSNEPCGCGSGLKYKHCCRNVPRELRTSWSELSIRERNLMFCNHISDVLCLVKGKTWLNVRRELSDNQVSEIYGFYSKLWPRETDIYSLLPKSDRRLRGLYSGLLDVRTIEKHALPMASFFDEFLIETPVINPNSVNSEFSPIESPGSFKYQALKDCFFMLKVEPFIRRGVVSLIPDPCDFDHHLRRAVMDMASSRSRAEEAICERDKRLFHRLAIEDFLNLLAMLPKDKRIQALTHRFGITKEAAIEIISVFERNTDASPLVMLQQMHVDHSGQFIQNRVGPNYEMALLVAQVTGSVLVTDSGTRWQEFVSAQHRLQGIVSYPWHGALNALNSIPIDLQFLQTFSKSQQYFALVRNLLKGADSLVLDDDRNTSRLNKLGVLAASLIDQLQQVAKPSATSSFKALSPDGGFYNANVQRLLTLSSCQRYDNQVRTVYGIGLPD